MYFIIQQIQDQGLHSENLKKTKKITFEKV